MKRIIKDAFAVIGKEGSTASGNGFIQSLWAEANENFGEIAHLAKKDADGYPIGVWGAMSDFSRAFQPWEDNFSKGLYLAGIECEIDAYVPPNWVKWIIPAYEYVVTENTGNDTFVQTIACLKSGDIPLVGAVHEYTCPKDGKNYLYFPIQKL